MKENEKDPNYFISQKYTLESLKKINWNYHNEHHLTQADVDMANRWVDLIKRTRDTVLPKVGDRVEYIDMHGYYYPNAHIEKINIEDGTVNICKNPSVPFLFRSKSEHISMFTSGGAWANISINMEYIGTEEYAFVDWGHGGPRGGAVTFLANVSKWRYVDPTPLFGKYTTKDYDKFCIHRHEKPVGRGYMITVTQAGISYNAFRTEDEYQGWLQLYHGVELEGYNNRQGIVWTFKQREKYLWELEEFMEVDGVIGQEQFYGQMTACKHVYEGTTVTKYILRPDKENVHS